MVLSETGLPAVFYQPTANMFASSIAALKIFEYMFSNKPKQLECLEGTSSIW